MKPVLGSLGANTLVILTPEESRWMREFLTWHANQADPVGRNPCRASDCLKAFNQGILRGTAHLTAEFADLQLAKKQGK